MNPEDLIRSQFYDRYASYKKRIWISQRWRKNVCISLQKTLISSEDYLHIFGPITISAEMDEAFQPWQA